MFDILLEADFIGQCKSQKAGEPMFGISVSYSKGRS